MTAREHLARLHLELMCADRHADAAAIKAAVAVCDEVEKWRDCRDDEIPETIVGIGTAVDAYREAK